MSAVSHRLRAWRRGDRRKGPKSLGQSAAQATGAWAEHEERALTGEEVQSLFSVTNICGISSLALRKVLSSSNPRSPSPGVSQHAKYLPGGFVRNSGRRAVGEDCPASPAIRACAFLCQQSYSQLSPGNKYWLLQHRPISDGKHVSQKGEFQ